MRRDLVQRAMAHDHEAFSELARLSVDRLHALARLILRDSQRAEDATQEALVLALRDLAALCDPDHFEVWMRRLLVNACYRDLRRERARRRFERISSRPGGASRMRVVMWPTATRSIAHSAVSSRSSGRSSSSTTTSACPLADTAEAMGLPLGTVKSRLHRATRVMRATLDADARAALTRGFPHDALIRLRPTHHRLARRGRPGASAPAPAP
jgi:RNA polymerase sigma-70 factor (ECF subfamily)